MSVSLEAMDIYVLMSVAVRMAPVHLWMDHVIAQLVLLGYTVTSHVLMDQLDSIAPNIATAQLMAPVTNSQGHVSKFFRIQESLRSKNENEDEYVFVCLVIVHVPSCLLHVI